MAVSSFFEIQTLERYVRQRPDQIGIPLRPSHTEIIWIRNSPGSCAIDGENMDTSGSRLYFIHTQQLRTIHACNETRGYILSFPFYEAEGCLATGTRKCIPVDEELGAVLEEIVGKLMREHAARSAFSGEIIKMLLQLLILYISRKVRADSPIHAETAGGRIIREFMVLVENNLRKKMLVADYASELCISPNYLNQVMKEIAYDLGFEDVAHFSKFFKTNSGLTFQEFKREYFSVCKQGLMRLPVRSLVRSE